MRRPSSGQPLCLFALVQAVLLIAALLISESHSFSPSLSLSSTSKATKFARAATKAPEAQNTNTMLQDYTDGELQEALNSMLADSKDANYDARHIFGYGQPDHKLSMLQIVTATRILDYKGLMVSANTVLYETRRVVFVGYCLYVLLQKFILSIFAGVIN